MSEMQSFSSNGTRVLFFGREKCVGTEALLKKLVRCGFDVTFVKSRKRGEVLPEDIYWWDGDYILCFRSLYVLPKQLLDKAKVAAINFHPAPPEYPGSGCVNFALYDNAAEYGVTAHIMNELVDNGDILEVRRFALTPCDDLSSVLSRTHNELCNLCLDFISGIYFLGGKFIEERLATSANEKWRGNARRLRELESLQKVNPNISEDELKRVVRATYIEGYPPVIELHGFKFCLELESK
uniref:Putative methionyl-tRNA formyltransferase n=1 Tax=Vibrio anguillarum serovar O2 TaxID=105260 RepID=A4Q8H9_VIBAN|nr:formyltransferase family protein [Vibrio anguillarum]CAJ87702.1 putative methionyl-tRNA formyltransferase [Vibrio anguillarum serovar O2]